MNNSSIKYSEQIDENTSIIFLLNELDSSNELISKHLSEKEIKYIKGEDLEKKPVCINQFNRFCAVVKIPNESEKYKIKEKVRHFGFEIYKYCKSHKIKSIQIIGNSTYEIDIAEGIALSAYDFIKYKTKDIENTHLEISIVNDNKNLVEELNNTIEATCFARDLVNEPQSYLTAEQLSNELENECSKVGISFTKFDFDKIKELKMGGLLAVNQGSVLPPTFNILEYKPTNAKNNNPLIFVGKGVVYDTGGLSLKPTPNSMDIMKCDMGGSATVAGAILAIAKNKLPYHVITLIPATDNRPSGNAYAPGDVLTMYNKSTVEVWNTDAEGRLILADALAYASQYNPELVIDVATLTGAAMRAIGKEATVMMGTATEDDKNKIKISGDNVYERLVEFPLWEEYAKSLKSDIADIRNLGEANAGAITAGKFLETFTDYPWMHLDIAAPAFLDRTDSYRGKNGTGVGVRLLYDFTKNLANE